MKKSNKFMSLLLAFAMVFSVVVPAFAETGSTGKPEANNKIEINVSASKDGKYDGVNQQIGLYVDKTGKNGKDFQFVEWGATENGRYTFKLNKPLESNATYTIVVGALTPEVGADKAYNAKLVMPGTQWKYSFNTDANGNPVELKEDYHFDLYVEPRQTDAFFTVTTLTKEAKTAPNKAFSIVPLKVNGSKYVTDKDGGFLVDNDRDALFTGTTDVYGEYGLTKEQVQAIATAAGYTVGEGKYATTVVGFVVNGELVAVADFHANSADRAAYLRPVPAGITKLVVTVEGDNRKVDINGNQALTPIKGATVELQGNTTEWHKEEAFGKVLDTKTTDAEGKAVFENPSISSLIRILDATDTAKEGYFTNIRLYNRVAVVKADGYRVPVTVSLENIDMVNGVMNVKFTLIPEGGIHTNRVRGANRYATSVAVAKKAFPGYKGDVLLASGDIYADALVANGLVGLKNQPLVLNGVNKLDATVAGYLKDVQAKKVTIIGGNTAISASVQNELEKMGLKTERIYGANRYETSVNVLQHFVKGGELREGSVSNVFVASGENFADALVASVPAAMYARPILLTAKDNLPKVVKDAIESKDYGIKEVTVVGGTGAVSEKAYAQINVSNVQRLKGQNRQLTAMAVANEYFMNAGQAIVVDGTKTQFADALAAGQLGWKIKAPILLSESNTVLGKDLAAYLRNNKMTEITIVGGTSSVSEGIAKEIDQIIAGK